MVCVRRPDSDGDTLGVQRDRVRGPAASRRIDDVL